MSTTARRALIALLAVVCCAVLAVCHATQRAEPPVVEKTAGDVAIPGVELQKGITVGAPKRFGNLSVFPVYAKSPAATGELTTLEAALEKGHAEVREVGEDESQAQVNTLQIENRGDKPIMVLAGTVVTGGKQDRQIAQDFVVEPGERTDVEAFCVERDRWEGTRDGKATGGKFTTLKSLANDEVRLAGQFEKDQRKVWSKVDKVNKANAKKAETATLAASLADPEIAAERKQLTEQVTAYLAEQRPSEHLVGFAYAIGDEVRTVRWFMNNQVFTMHREVLVNTAAMEAITAAADGSAKVAADVGESKVVAFVASFAAERAVEERDKHNVRAKQEADSGYGWSLKYGDEAAAAEQADSSDDSPKAKPAKRPALSTGFSKKK